MKRKLIALALTLTTIFACFSMTMMSATADEVVEAPVVAFAGHQRTVVADTTYGIRFVGTTTNLNAKKIIFNIALVDNAGNVARFNQEITTVYTAIVEEIDGTSNTTTAAELGSNYIFSVVIPDVEIGYGYLGYLCSITYIGLDDSVSTTDTYDFIYNNANLWADYGIGERVKTEFIGQSMGTNPSLVWVRLDQGEDGVFDEMWNNDTLAEVKDWGRSEGFTTWGANVGAFTAAELNPNGEAIQIARLSFTVERYSQQNLGAQVQVATHVDQENLDNGDWKTIYTFAATNNANDNYFFTENGTFDQRSMCVDIDDLGFYKYIRIVGAGANYGIYLSDVGVYSKVALPGLETVDVAFHEYNQGKATDLWITGGDTSAEAIAAKGAQVFDQGATSATPYFNASGVPVTESYLTGKLEQKTVIKKIVLESADRRQTEDENVTVQVSVDGTEGSWVDVYTITSFDMYFLTYPTKDHAYTVNDNNLKVYSSTDWGLTVTLPIALEDDTPYQFVRVLDNGPGGFGFKEIWVYGEDSACASLKTLLANTTLEYQG